VEPALPLPAPVFIHSAWRTASTYLWAKLGRSPGNLGFCEPYNEVLSHLGLDGIHTLRSDGWGSGHPALAAPYFAEYEELVQDPGGIAKFQSRFSYADYYELDPAAVEPQRDYLQNILDFAQTQGARPVLGFCRSLGRLPWLTRAFPTTLHIELRRDPLSQFLSAYYQYVRRDNPYFIVGYVTVAGLSTGSPYMEGVRNRLGIPWTPSREPAEAFGFFQAWVARQTPEVLFQVFWHVHTLNAHRSQGLADLVVDIDQLAASGSYRAGLERELSRYGFAVSFDDAKIPTHAEDELAGRLDDARQLADAYTAAWQRNGVPIGIPEFKN
jgi:hypothetical protein